MSTINGREYQHGTIDFQLTGGEGPPFQLESFKDVSWEIGAEKKPVHNAKGKVVGYTIDKETPNGSVTMLLSEFFALKDWAAQRFNGLGILQCEFGVKLTYGNDLADLRSDEISILFQKEGRKS